MTSTNKRVKVINRMLVDIYEVYTWYVRVTDSCPADACTLHVTRQRK